MRVSLRLLVIGCLISTLGGCAGGGTSAGLAESETRMAVPDFLTSVLNGERALGYTEIVEQLGPPVRTQAQPMTGSAPDSLRKVFYYGFEVWLHESMPGAQVARLAVTGARHATPVGLRVGYARPVVIQSLGLPVRESMSEMVYEQQMPVPVEMILFFEKSAISRIEWRFK